MTHFLALIPTEHSQWRIVRNELDLLEALRKSEPFASANYCGLGRGRVSGGTHNAPPDPLSRTVTNRHGAQQHIGLVELGWRAYRELVG